MRSQIFQDTVNPERQFSMRISTECGNMLLFCFGLFQRDVDGKKLPKEAYERIMENRKKFGHVFSIPRLVRDSDGRPVGVSVHTFKHHSISILFKFALGFYSD